MASNREAITSQLAETIQQLKQYTERHPNNAEAWLKLGLVRTCFTGLWLVFFCCCD
jgi:hypothetical protein